MNEKGLYGKFWVRRRDGRDEPGGDKEAAAYFVLDFVHDPHALPALLAYADSVEADEPALAADLRAIVDAARAAGGEHG